MTTILGIKTQYEALHGWDDAPAPVGFLRHPHHHIFKFRLELTFEGSPSRPLEFFLVKKELDKAIREVFLDFGVHLHGDSLFNFIDTSCEQIASYVLERLPKWAGVLSKRLRVQEDDNHYAEVSCL
jgi:hypothetical protein